MPWNLLIAITNPAAICVRNVPESTRHIFLPVLDSITVKVTLIIDPSWVGFVLINYPISIQILFTIIEVVAIGVVVPGV